MSMAQASPDVLEQLEHALGTNMVPDEGKRRAAQLISRLKAPVQVVLIGASGSGKSRLVNMLIGEPLVSDGIELPPLEVAFGPRPKTSYLLGDGSRDDRDGLHLDQAAPDDTAIMRIELPLKILKRLTLTELTLAGSQAEQMAIADWAMQRADIVLWCSQTFDKAEQDLWSAAPETLKDHSFLVLTKADQLQMQGVLSQRIDQLADIVSDGFMRMYPVATIQAISAHDANGLRDEDMWTSSGGRALAEAIQQLAETGRRGDADNALMFLNRYGATLASSPQGAVPAGPTPHKAEPQAADTKEITQAFGQAQTFGRALAFLQERADLMLGLVDDSHPDNQLRVLDHCLETADGLSQIMMQVDPAQAPLGEMHDDVMECSDMMVLFHLEKTPGAAADAVTLLLQLKKELAVAATA